MKRGLAALMLAASVLTMLFGLGAGVAAAADCLMPNDPPEEGTDPYDGTDPTRNRLPYTPWRIMHTPCSFPREFRAIVVEPARVTVIEGGHVIGAARLPTSGELRFEDVVAAVDDPAWIAEVEPGVFLVDTAVIQRDTVMTVRAPAARELRLTTRPHVFIGGLRSTARFEGVTVTSWDPASETPDRDLADGRPFVVYSVDSRLDVLQSRFQYLGTDRTEAYGVAWRRNTTGTLTESTFAHNFFGAYLYDADAVEIRNNVFHDSVSYGLDPRDHSRNLVIEGNEAYGNGTHGIVLSSFVRDSVIRNNSVHHNGRNGIVLHAGSNHNLVEENVVEHNHDDGIVVIDSADNRIARNAVRGHEVGIRLNGRGTERMTVQANTLEDNRSGLKAYGGANFVVAEHNVYRRTGTVAVSIEAPQFEIHNDQIDGSRLGVDLVGGESVIRSLRVVDVDEGVVARAGARTDLADVTVRARRLGIRAVPGSDVRRTGVVDAPDPREGSSSSRSSRAVFAYVGLTAIAVAVALHGLSVTRNPGRPGGRAPAHVRNTA